MYYANTIYMRDCFCNCFADAFMNELPVIASVSMDFGEAHSGLTKRGGKLLLCSSKATVAPHAGGQIGTILLKLDYIQYLQGDPSLLSGV